MSDRGHFLFEKVIGYECQGAVEPGPSGCQIVLSPDGTHAAVIEPSELVFGIVSLTREAKSLQPQRFSASPVVVTRAGEQVVREVFTAVAWNPSGSKVAVAGTSGSIYLFEKSGSLSKDWSSRDVQLPWCRAQCRVVGLALVSKDTLLLMTNTAQLYTLPLDASVKQWEKLKPNKLQGVHAEVCTFSYITDHRMLLVAGHGSDSGHCPGVCVSLWKWHNEKGISDVPVKWHGQTQAAKEAGQTRAWSVAVSSHGDHVAVVSGKHRVVVLSLPEGNLQPLATSPDTHALAQTVTSAAWVSATNLAIATSSGTTAVLSVRSGENVLGLPGAAPEQFVSGCTVSIKRQEPDAGLLVLEPCPTPTLAWRLTVLARRTPDELLDALSTQHDWATAARLCQEYGLNGDMVYRSRWESGVITAELITDCLASMSDQAWVCHQVLTGRCAPDADTQRLLLQHALDVSTPNCALPDEDGRWWRQMRLSLLSQKDRLELLLALHDGLYEPETYTALRSPPLVEVAQAFAATGNLPALSLLVASCPCLLGPHLLTLLNFLPETLDPRTYSQLLPRADDTEMPLPTLTRAGPAGGDADAATALPVREADWLESGITARELIENGFDYMCELTETMAAVAHGRQAQHLPLLPAEEVEQWYCDRAVHLDTTTRTQAHAVALLDMALLKGAKSDGRVGVLLRHAKVLNAVLPALTAEHLGGDGPAWLMTLDLFASMTAADQFKLVMATSTVDTLEQDIVDRAAPFLLDKPSSEVPQLLTDFLARELCTRPEWCERLVQVELERPRMCRDALRLTRVVCQAVGATTSTTAWEPMSRMLESLSPSLEDLHDRAQRQGDEQLMSRWRHAAGVVGNMIKCVAAGSWLADHGVQISVPVMQRLDASKAQRLITKVLNKAERSGGQWSSRQWSELWSGLLELHGTVLTAMAPEAMLQQYIALLLRVGKIDLARKYLTATDGVQLDAEQGRKLVVSAAQELLAAASSVTESSVKRAEEILSLAANDPVAQLELSLIAILDKLNAHGFPIAPAQLKQHQALHAAAAGADEGVDASLSADGRLELLSYLLQQGKAQRLAAHLDLVLDLVGLLRLDQPTGLQVKAKFMIAQSCAESADWEVASGLIVALVDEGLEECAPLAAQLACNKAGRLLSPDVRIKLLSFATVYATPQELPPLLDELLEAQSLTRPAEVQELVAAAPEYQLRRALAAEDAPLPLPSYADMPLALAVLASVATPEDVTELVNALVGDPETMTLARFAVVQRGLLAGIQSLSVRALQLSGVPATQLLQLQQTTPPLTILQQAESQCGADPAAQSSVHAAQALAQKLQAVVDGRQLRTLVPSAQTTDLMANDPRQRAQAMRQQACVAGQQAGGISPDGSSGPATPTSVAAGQKLLGNALQLCAQYKVSVWSARLEFVCAAVHAASQVSPELKTVLVEQWQQLLQPDPDHPQPAPLLLSTLSSVLWPSVPSSSTSHLSLLLALTLTCLSHMDPLPHAGTPQRLTKFIDLLEKASGALKGLSMRPILAPLLRIGFSGMTLPEPCAVLSGTGRSSGGSGMANGSGGGGEQPAGSQQGSLISRQPVAPGALDPDLPALVTEAQAVVYSYTTAQNIGIVQKVLKAVQNIITQGQGSSQDGTPEAAAFAKVVTQLPMTLPYSCLLCKNTSTSAAQPAAPAAAPVLDAAAWAGLWQTCSGKLSPKQLMAWLDFMLFGGKQPLGASVAGRLTPLMLSPAMQLAVLQSVLPQLPECGPAGLQSGKPLPDALVRALAQYGRLRVLAAVTSTADMPAQVCSQLEPQVLQACDQAATSKGQSGAPAYSLLCEGISCALLAGAPYPAVVALAEAALPEPALAVAAQGPCGYSPNSTATSLVAQQLEQQLQAATSHFSSTQQAPDIAAQQTAAAQLQQLVHSLAVTDTGAEGTAEGLEAARGTVVEAVSKCVEGLDAAQYALPGTAALLQVHVGIMSGQAWPGFSVGGATSVFAGDPGAAQALSSRVLMASTLSHLSKVWQPAPALQLEDLTDTDTATACFERLLAEAHTEEQLKSLQQLLATVWLHGTALPQATAAAAQPAPAHTAAEETTEPQPPEEQAAEAPDSAPEAAEGSSTAPAAVPLHACWAQLLQACVAQHQTQLFCDILTHTQQSQSLPLLTAEEVAQCADHMEGVHKGLILALQPPPAACTSSSQLVEQLAQVYQESGPQLLVQATDTAAAHLLAAATLALQPLSQPNFPDSAVSAVEQALVALAMRDSHSDASLVLLPSLVAQLCVAKRFAVAASLAAQTCRWTTALRALGGTMRFLEHFLSTLAHGTTPAAQPSDLSAQLLQPSLPAWTRAALAAVKSDAGATH